MRVSGRLRVGKKVLTLSTRMPLLLTSMVQVRVACVWCGTRSKGGAGPGTVSPRTAVNFFPEILIFNTGKVVFQTSWIFSLCFESE